MYVYLYMNAYTYMPYAFTVLHNVVPNVVTSHTRITWHDYHARVHIYTNVSQVPYSTMHTYTYICMYVNALRTPKMMKTNGTTGPTSILRQRRPRDSTKR